MYWTPLLCYFLLSALSLVLHSHCWFLALSDYLACLWFWFHWLVVYFAFLGFLGLLWEFFFVLLHCLDWEEEERRVEKGSLFHCLDGRIEENEAKRDSLWVTETKHFVSAANIDFSKLSKLLLCPLIFVTFFLSL